MQTSRRRVRKLDLVLAIIIAFGAWIYVVYNVDPTVTTTFHDVPVKFVNEDEMQSNELAIRSVEFESIDVTIEARRSVMNTISNDRIIVNADLANVGKGENLLALNVTVPNNATVTEKSKDTIKVIVEEIVTRSFTIDANDVVITGLGEGYTAVSEDDVTVLAKGTEGELDKLDASQFRVSADASHISQIGTYSVEIVLTTEVKSASLEHNIIYISVEQKEDD